MPFLSTHFSEASTLRKPYASLSTLDWLPVDCDRRFGKQNVPSLEMAGDVHSFVAGLPRGLQRIADAVMGGADAGCDEVRQLRRRAARAGLGV